MWNDDDETGNKLSEMVHVKWRTCVSGTTLREYSCSTPRELSVMADSHMEAPARCDV